MVPVTQGSWLLIGCGYVGRRVLGRLRATGATVAAITRDPARAADFDTTFGARAVVGDFADGRTVRAACAGLPAPLRVLCLLPPSACADDQGTLAPLTSLLAALHDVAPARAVLTSSTGVYGEQGGAVVSAETPCRPQTAREQALYAIEQCWLDGPRRHVLRYAGLYGPGRIIGLGGLRQRNAVAGDPDGWLNLIHRDDAAALLLRVALGPAAAIELGGDGAPVTRRVYYASLAALAGAPAPVFDGATPARGGGARRCDPASTRARLAWRPMFRDFRAGLAACAEVRTA